MEHLIRYRSEIIGIFICLTLGMLSGYAVHFNDYMWMNNLNKPSFHPPNWIFAPMWTFLYILIGIALGKIWDQRHNSKLLLTVFVVQFVLNLLWTPLFFKLHRIDLALYDNALLWLSIIIFMFLARKNYIIFLLFVPYFLWVSFALLLNFKLYQMNVI